MAAPGALLAPLGPCLALPGRSWEPFSSPRGLLWELFGSLFPTPLEKHENLDFRRQLQRNSRFWRPGGVQNRTQMAPKSLLGASWRLLALSWRLSALSLASLGGLLALLGPLGRLLGRSWGDFSSNKKPGYHGTGSALEARAASTASGEQQSRKASRKHSLQASRARSAPPLSVLSWGFAWNASRAGGRNGSLQTKKNLSKMAPKCHPGGSKIAPRSLQGGSQGAPPGERKRKWSPFLFLLFDY